MIFVTVGTQLPFDRLIQAVDTWAGNAGRTDVIAQVGRSRYVPRSLRWHDLLGQNEFERLFDEAEVVISHAGMGTIISALKRGKPLLVMPRMERLGEQRNDHQIATAEGFRALGYVSVAMDERELTGYLDSLDRVRPGPIIGDFASPRLIAAVREFVFPPHGNAR